MKVTYLRTENPKEDTPKIIEYLEHKRQEKLLLVNLFQENRAIENGLKVEEFMVYNSYDYFKDVCDFEKAVCEFEDDFHILPSTIKKEEIKVDISKLLNELEELDDEDYTYKNIYVLYSIDDLLDLDKSADLVNFSGDKPSKLDNEDEEKAREREENNKETEKSKEGSDNLEAVANKKTEVIEKEETEKVEKEDEGEALENKEAEEGEQLPEKEETEKVEKEDEGEALENKEAEEGEQLPEKEEKAKKDGFFAKIKRFFKR